MAPKRWGKKGKKPAGYSTIEPLMEALENELRDKVKESNDGKRNTESLWPVHQIGHQRSRYVYDMYYTHHRITRDVYDYCLKQKLVDANLIAKWKKPGYERLCSTYVINPANYKFGTTSICRVPMQDRGEMQKTAQDPTTGCLGCASGSKAGPKNIFGNKYGQNLAAVQIAREARMEAIRVRREEQARQRHEREEEERREQQAHSAAAIMQAHESTTTAAADSGDSETDDDDDSSDDDDDYGPSPAAGVWAGTRKLEVESQKIIEDDDDDQEEGEELNDERVAKKSRIS